MTLEVFSNLCDSMTLPGMSLDVSTHPPAVHTCVCLWAQCGHTQHIPHLTPSPPPFLQLPVGHKAPPLPLCVCPLLQSQDFSCLPLSHAGSAASASIRTCAYPAQEISAGAAVLPPHSPIPAWTEAEPLSEQGAAVTATHRTSLQVQR